MTSMTLRHQLAQNHNLLFLPKRTLVVYNGSEEQGQEDAEPADWGDIVECLAEDAGVGGCNGSVDAIWDGGGRGIERLHY